jgi:hypothetical protein
MRNLITAIGILLFLAPNSWGESPAGFSCQGPLQPSKSLLPLPTGIKAGAPWSYDLKKQQASNDWCQIPRWLVGDWKEKSITQTYSKNLITGQIDTNTHTLINSSDRDFEPISGRFFKPEFWFGTQKDSSNQFWQFVGSPIVWITSIATSSPTLVFKEFDRFSTITANNVERRYVLTTLVFGSPDTDAGKIKSVKRCEFVVDYFRIKEGVINTATTITEFNEDGQPISESKTNGQLWRVKDEWDLQRFPYWEVPDGTQVDGMNAMLSKFIATHGSK